MSTPPYVAPNVSAAGLTINGYPSIQADNVQQFLNIYGQNQYVDPDSAVYQFLSIFSLKTADCNNALQLVYNQTSRSTAVGAGLDRLAAMVGIARDSFSYSTVNLTLTGAPGATLNNCLAKDNNNFLWSIPSGTIITGGSVTVQAVCMTPGAIAAEPGTVTTIATPVPGWTGVTNSVAAVLGTSVEIDSTFRARMALSVALPSRTRLVATLAAIAAVPGVTRYNSGQQTPGSVEGTSVENPTGAVDYWGNPAHSISMVVEGGADADVAQAIYSNRSLGCFTNGTTVVPVTDPNTGVVMNVGFFRPTYIDIAVQVTIHLLAGGTADMATTVQTDIVNYINSLGIGESVVYSEIYGAALNARPNPILPAFSITSLKIGTQTAQGVFKLVLGSITATFVSGASGGTPVVGQLIVDFTIPGNLPVGTTVASLSGSNIVMSQAATANAAADTIQTFNMGNADIAIGFSQVSLTSSAYVQVMVS